LWWPGDAAAPVLQAWRQLTEGDLPEEFTSAARLANFPQIPGDPRIPARAVLRHRLHQPPWQAGRRRPPPGPRRARRPPPAPTAPIPLPARGGLHMDPEQPARSVTKGPLVASLPAEATQTFAGAAGPGADIPPFWAELLRIGGELKRVRPA